MSTQDHGSARVQLDAKYAEEPGGRRLAFVSCLPLRWRRPCSCFVALPALAGSTAVFVDCEISLSTGIATNASAIRCPSVPTVRVARH
jgi:hypothetical protein